MYQGTWDFKTYNNANKSPSMFTHLPSKKEHTATLPWGKYMQFQWAPVFSCFPKVVNLILPYMVAHEKQNLNYVTLWSQSKCLFQRVSEYNMIMNLKDDMYSEEKKTHVTEAWFIQNTTCDTLQISTCIYWCRLYKSSPGFI